MAWPTKDEYDLAISQWQRTVWDPDIRSGTLSQDEMGIRRYGGANLYVCIYKIGDWTVRCFCSNPPNQTPPDIVDRYMAIDRFCRTNASWVSALLPVTYIERGITVGQRVLPLVKMPFLTSTPPLGEFIADNYQNQAKMQQLSDAWFEMIRELEAVSMAHGDLDLTNVLVEQRGPSLSLKLIDYDNVWIPELAGYGQTEYGHEAFQHPAFFSSRSRPYNAEMDRFSALVIYISLKMLVYRPELYAEWSADESEQLLLSSADYQSASLATSHIAQLRKLSRSDMLPYIDELSACLREKRMPRSLERIVVNRYQPPNPTPEPRYKPVGTSVQSLPPVSLWENKILNGATSYPAAPTSTLSFSSQPLDDDKLVLSQPPPLPTRQKISPLVLTLSILIGIFLVVATVVIVLFATHVLTFASHQGMQYIAAQWFAPFMILSRAQGGVYVAA